MGQRGVGIYDLEAALALAIEAAGGALRLWEEEGEERFGDELRLSVNRSPRSTQVRRLAYIARLLDTAALPTACLRVRDRDQLFRGEVGSPVTWNEEAGSIRSLPGLNDILYGLPPENDAGSCSY